MKKFSGAFVVFLVIVGLGAYMFGTGHAHGPQDFSSQLRSDQRVITVAGERLVVDLATTTAEREQGLSGRPSLAPDRGMLFVFPQDGVYRFWMKEMDFPLDIIWISVDGKVVYIEPSLAPSTYPNAYGPNGSARYVLEVNSGFAASHGLTVGDQVGL